MSAAQASRHYCTLVTETISFKGRVYNLCSVVVHLGKSPRSGHYIAIARHTVANGQWWLYDDANRREARPDEVATTATYRNYGCMKSYVLFYQLRNATHFVRPDLLKAHWARRSIVLTNANHCVHMFH